MEINQWGAMWKARAEKAEARVAELEQENAQLRQILITTTRGHLKARQSRGSMIRATDEEGS